MRLAQPSCAEGEKADGSRSGAEAGAEGIFLGFCAVALEALRHLPTRERLPTLELALGVGHASAAIAVLLRVLATRR